MSLLVGLLALGCSPGPDQPDHFLGRGLRLKARFVDGPDGTADAAILMLGFLDTCHPEEPAPAGPSVFISATTLGVTDGDGTFSFESVDLSAQGAGGTRTACPFGSGPLFYRISASLGAAPPWIAPWKAADELVFAYEPTTIVPFGPNGARAELPQGYSLLRRSCEGGGVKMDVVRPADAVVELRRALPDPAISGALPVDMIEREERAFLDGCGVRPPPVDLGTPLSFDRAERLAFAADGAGLVYLGAADPSTAASPLRTVALADGASKAIIDVPTAVDVTGDDAGRPYVQTDHHWARVIRRADGSAALQDLPADSAVSVLSPDGRWLAGDTRLWNTDTNALTKLDDGYFALVAARAVGRWSAVDRFSFPER